MKYWYPKVGILRFAVPVHTITNYQVKNQLLIVIRFTKQVPNIGWLPVQTRHRSALGSKKFFFRGRLLQYWLGIKK